MILVYYIIYATLFQAVYSSFLGRKNNGGDHDSTKGHHRSKPLNAEDPVYLSSNPSKLPRSRSSSPRAFSRLKIFTRTSNPVSGTQRGPSLIPPTSPRSGIPPPPSSPRRRGSTRSSSISEAPLRRSSSGDSGILRRTSISIPSREETERTSPLLKRGLSGTRVTRSSSGTSLDTPRSDEFMVRPAERERRHSSVHLTPTSSLAPVTLIPSMPPPNQVLEVNRLPASMTEDLIVLQKQQKLRYSLLEPIFRVCKENQNKVEDKGKKTLMRGDLALFIKGIQNIDLTELGIETIEVFDDPTYKDIIEALVRWTWIEVLDNTEWETVKVKLEEFCNAELDPFQSEIKEKQDITEDTEEQVDETEQVDEIEQVEETERQLEEAEQQLRQSEAEKKLLEKQVLLLEKEVNLEHQELLLTQRQATSSPSLSQSLDNREKDNKSQSEMHAPRKVSTGGTKSTQSKLESTVQKDEHRLIISEEKEEVAKTRKSHHQHVSKDANGPPSPKEESQRVITDQSSSSSRSITHTTEKRNLNSSKERGAIKDDITSSNGKRYILREPGFPLTQIKSVCLIVFLFQVSLQASRFYKLWRISGAQLSIAFCGSFIILKFIPRPHPLIPFYYLLQEKAHRKYSNQIKILYSIWIWFCTAFDLQFLHEGITWVCWKLLKLIMTYFLNGKILDAGINTLKACLNLIGGLGIIIIIWVLGDNWLFITQLVYMTIAFYSTWWATSAQGKPIESSE